jgi:hypothetical protein
MKTNFHNARRKTFAFTQNKYIFPLFGGGGWKEVFKRQKRAADNENSRYKALRGVFNGILKLLFLGEMKRDSINTLCKISPFLDGEIM